VEGRFLQTHSAEKSVVGYLLPFGKETTELILRDYMMTWPERKGRMDGQAIELRDKLGIKSIRGSAWQGINMNPECM
jgi:hypothetical protein